MSDPQATLKELLERMAELADLGGAQALLSWDQETYMPKGAQQARASQSSTLGAMIHRRFTDPRVGEMLAELRANSEALDPDARIAVERVSWEHARATKIPERLVREMTTAQSNSVAAWSEARQADDFPAFLPHLERLLELGREYADHLRREGQSRYDVLLEGFERGATTEAVRSVFSELRDRVAVLTRKIAESGRPVSTRCLNQRFDVDRQWDFGVEILKAMGFDFDCGRQDKSAHPFTSGTHSTDVRITTRFDENFLNPGLFATIHEGGHALYEQGIDPKDWRTPLGGSISLGIHESQSRMWENMIGRSRPFWRFYYPRLQKVFSDRLGNVDLEEFYRAVNAVEPSLIRVEADEVTYSLHIILRFELEQDLIEKRLAPADLPEAWRAKVRQYLGIETPNDREGCLQDIHWAWGMFGYFPTYTLGNLYAAQIFERVKIEIPDLTERVEKGELAVLREWLREKVHKVGNRRFAAELIRDITGSEPQAEPFVRYLESKFGEIYGL
jgi:carboxypeptidase Taq